LLSVEQRGGKSKHFEVDLKSIKYVDFIASIV
jgi:hypothetical protein